MDVRYSAVLFIPPFILPWHVVIVASGLLLKHVMVDGEDFCGLWPCS